MHPSLLLVHAKEYGYKPVCSGTYIDLGDGKIDQTTQGVRFRGKFDDNYLIFLSGAMSL